MGCGASSGRTDVDATKEVVPNSSTPKFDKVDAESFYLAGAIGTDMPKVNSLVEHTPAKFDGTLDAFREANKEDEQLIRRLRNKVLVCSCGKACAYTLTHCNSCGTSLENVNVSYNDNIFMAFVHGVARGKYEYTISMRHQEEDVMCFDDILSMSVIHFNAIPSSHYIPDCRYLFKNPVIGLAIVDRLFTVASQAALDQFWSSEAYRKRLLAGVARPDADEEMRRIVLAGMNFPPSMYQLHLQFIHPPMLPFHWNLVQTGQHFTKGRWFPLEYIRDALALGPKVKREVTDDTDINEIMTSLSVDHGIVYDDYYDKFVKKLYEQQKIFGSVFVENGFKFKVQADKVMHLHEQRGTEAIGEDAAKLKLADAKVLNCYGCPYTADGKKSGTYYKYAKDPSEVKDFALADSAPAEAEVPAKAAEPPAAETPAAEAAEPSTAVAEAPAAEGPAAEAPAA